jgi:hypothetical protein
LTPTHSLQYLAHDGPDSIMIVKINQHGANNTDN